MYIPYSIQKKIQSIVKNTPKCIETGKYDYQGYAMFQTKKRGKKFHIRGSRASYQMFVGKLDDKKEFICHKCDNPKCINPKHLFKGSHQDNMNDMVAKGRSCKGPKNHFWIDGRSHKIKIKAPYNPQKKGKMTEEKILKVLAYIKDGHSLKEIAEKCQVPLHTIKDISSGRVYKPIIKKMAVINSSTKE